MRRVATTDPCHPPYRRIANTDPCHPPYRRIATTDHCHPPYHRIATTDHCHPERNLVRFLRQMESKDLRFLRVRQGVRGETQILQLQNAQST